MATLPVYVGIDVAKAHLDVAIGSTGTVWQVPSDDAGLGTLVVLEATGRYAARQTASWDQGWRCFCRCVRRRERRRTLKPRVDAGCTVSAIGPA